MVFVQIAWRERLKAAKDAGEQVDRKALGLEIHRLTRFADYQQVNVNMKNVGKYQSCMFAKLRISTDGESSRTGGDFSTRPGDSGGSQAVLSAILQAPVFPR